MEHRIVKDRLFEAWADTAKALASPKRMELLDLLAQAERTVDSLARETALSITNASSHLGVLRAARLVDTRKSAQFVYYRLSDDSVVALMRQLQRVARLHSHEVEHLARTHIDSHDEMEPIDASELQRRIDAGTVTVIDVRPAFEFDAGHIDGAISIPLDEIDARMGELRKRQPIVAYCRGPYCIFAVEAVEQLRRHGFNARRLIDGLPDWRASGRPIATGASPQRSRARRTVVAAGASGTDAVSATQAQMPSRTTPRKTPRASP